MKYFLILWLFFISQFSSAQIRFRNLDLRYPDSAVLFSYLDITLDLVNIPFDSSIYLIYIVDGRSEKLLPFKGSYNVFTTSLQPLVINAYKGKRKIFEKTFRIVKRPDPLLRFFGSSDSFVSKSQILLNPRIELSLPECLYIHYQGVVYSCILEIKIKGQEAQRFFIQHGQLTSEALDLVQRLRPGDKLHFIDFKVGGPPSFCPRGFGDRLITIR